MATSKPWRKSVGERGCRVVVFERTVGGILYREAWVGGERITKKSLGHRDKERAEAEAYQLVAKLKTRQDALDGGKLILSTLFDMYRSSPQFAAKKPRTQQEDRSKLERIRKFLGGEREVRTLSASDVERYRQARMSGAFGPTSRGVRPRAVEADLTQLRAALNWATKQRNGRGQVLLEFSPLRGVKLPSEKNPRRPVETYDTFLKLMAVAEDVDWRLPMVLQLVESNGQRISSVLRLRRGDVDLLALPYGRIRFRAEEQKTGYEHEVALTPETAGALKAHQARLPDDPDAWLFPSASDPEQPVSRRVMDESLIEAYRRAGLERQPGGLWHPWRRKWATERKEMPLKDVAAAGGWKEPRTLLICYQQTDQATMDRVVLEAPKLRAKGIELVGQEVAPAVAPPDRQRSSA